MTRATRSTSPLWAGMALCAALLLLAGCAKSPEVARLVKAGIIATHSRPPSNAPPGSCWNKETTPPKIKTVIEPVLVHPAQHSSTGKLITPPIYRKEPQTRITAPGKERWFEVPCPASLTSQYISSLQRALAVRGYYSGPVSGAMDKGTRSAIRRLQSARGLDSAILSLDTARQLGLAPAILATPGES